VQSNLHYSTARLQTTVLRDSMAADREMGSSSSSSTTALSRNSTGILISRDQQVMGLLLPDAGPPELLGFDDRSMMYEGDAKNWEAQLHWHGDQLRR
jgi:hypothetical protein